jgi:predicted SAM-dependent methyltransferase
MKKIRLHLGCGKRCIPGFVNVDLADFPHIHYRRSIDNLEMFPDSSAELIYTSHTLEYFDRVQAVGVLHEWCRVLCPGGILRLAVPDFAAMIEVYRDYNNLGLILGPLYGRMEIAGTEQIIYHKTVYDFDSLRQLLESCGFENIRRYDWRQTIHRDYDDHSQAYIPHMDKDKGRLISLNIEATKATVGARTETV